MMKIRFLILFVVAFLMSCSDTPPNSNCGFLVDAGVEFTVNLNLPQFNTLRLPSNSVYVTNQGNGGVFVTSTLGGLLAWDAADPNHIFSECSIMSLTDGITAKCNCEDGNSYELITGQSIGEKDLPCGLKPYRVEKTGQDSYIIRD